MLGHSKIVELLLEDERVHPGVFSNEALRHACMHGHLDVVKLLLQDKRVNPSDYGNLRYTL
jgi:hypothetical protein